MLPPNKQKNKIPGPPPPDANSVASLTKYFLCGSKAQSGRGRSQHKLTVIPVSLTRDIKFTSNGSQCAW